MNREKARKIAEIITNSQLQEMFDNAKKGITDWKKVSRVNKGLTKGVAWNILAKDFNIDVNYHIMAKINMVREFGDYLPEELQPKPDINRVSSNPTHQDPIF